MLGFKVWACWVSLMWVRRVFRGTRWCFIPWRGGGLGARGWQCACVLKLSRTRGKRLGPRRGSCSQYQTQWTKLSSLFSPIEWPSWQKISLMVVYRRTIVPSKWDWGRRNHVIRTYGLWAVSESPGPCSSSLCFGWCPATRTGPKPGSSTVTNGKTTHLSLNTWLPLLTWRYASLRLIAFYKWFKAC